MRFIKRIDSKFINKTNYMVCFSLLLFVSSIVFVHNGIGTETKEKANNLISNSQRTIKIYPVDSETPIQLELKSSYKRNMLPVSIIAETVDTEIADMNLPRFIYIPYGSKAYRITAKYINGKILKNDEIKDNFRLGLSYSPNTNLEMARNLRLFILSDDRWLPVPSQVDISSKMVKTDLLNQSGIYRMLAQATTEPTNVFIYPNPVQFGSYGGVSKTLKFRNVPLGSIIEIYTITGEQIREIKVEKTEIIWDGKKENGDIVTSGLYIYKVRTAGKETFGKIAVLK